MAFKRLRLPLALAYGSGGGPRFKTDLVEMNSGIESRNQVWEFERLEYECHYDATVVAIGGRRVSFETMHKFFRIMGGMAHTFLARDPLEYICAVGEGFFVTSTGSPTGKQMVRRFTIGAYSVDVMVTKPVTGTIVTDAVGLDYDTGIAASGTYWSGQYDKHVRFDTDSIKPKLINKEPGASGSYIVAWEPLPIIEVKGE